MADHRGPLGVVGLGAMGLPVTRRLRSLDYPVYVYDLNPAAVQVAVSHGAIAVGSPGAMLDVVDVVLTVLPASKEVGQACFGSGGFCPDGQAPIRPFTHLDLSTIDPIDSGDFTRRFAALGVTRLDTPVGRQTRDALTGNLLVMAGGDRDAFARYRPILEDLGNPVIYCGAAGMGSAMKLVNNMLSITTLAATAESIYLGLQTGLSLETMLEVLTQTAARNGALLGNLQKTIFQGDTTPGFKIALAHKDLGLATSWANALRLPVPIASSARERYSEAQRRGFANEDSSAIFKVYEELTGLQARLSSEPD